MILIMLKLRKYIILRKKKIYNNYLYTYEK